MNEHAKRPVVFDDDNPEWTKEDFERAKPADKVHSPKVVEQLVRTRGPQKAPTKKQVTLRLSPEVIAYFKKGGKGWQTRINEALRKIAGVSK